MATLLSAELTEGEEEEGGAGRWTAVSASVRVSEVTTAMAEATPPPAPPTPPGLLTVAAVVVVVFSACTGDSIEDSAVVASMLSTSSLMWQGHLTEKSHLSAAVKSIFRQQSDDAL